jgi:HlyD family secretion protein
MRKIALIALVTVAATAVVYFLIRGAGSRPNPAVLRLSGNIEAHESVVSFKVQGRIVELPVQEGQQVTKGDLLARLDDDDYRQQVSVDEATVLTREAELNLTLAGSRHQEIKAAQQALLDAEADLHLRKLQWRRLQAIADRRAVSQEDLDVAAANLKRSHAIYRRSQENYNQIAEGSRKEQIAVSRANLRLARENLEASRVKLGYTRLRAPTSGIILVRQAELGEVVAPGTPVVTIGDLDHVWLRGYVGETDLGRVRWGQPATIRTDTYPDKAYHGRVSFISSQAEFTPKSVETHQERVTLVYRVKLDLDNPNHELKPGMPADAVIDTSPPQ